MLTRLCEDRSSRHFRGATGWLLAVIYLCIMIPGMTICLLDEHTHLTRLLDGRDTLDVRSGMRGQVRQLSQDAITLIYVALNK